MKETAAVAQDTGRVVAKELSKPRRSKKKTGAGKPRASKAVNRAARRLTRRATNVRRQIKLKAVRKKG